MASERQPGMVIDWRQVDYALAMALLGWEPVEDKEFGLWFRVPGGGYNPTGFGSEDTPPLLSTTWDGMGVVIEAMRAKGWTIDMLDNCSEWHVEAGNGEIDAPQALAIAALRALAPEKARELGL